MKLNTYEENKVPKIESAAHKEKTATHDFFLLWTLFWGLLTIQKLEQPCFELLIAMAMVPVFHYLKPMDSLEKKKDM